MSEKMLRYIVNEINKLLEIDYNMISFDSLSKNALLQICADCLTKLDALPKVEIDRNTEESLTKLLDVLCNIKIPTILNMNINEFTDGIIQGKRTVLHNTLNSILNNQSEVKKRAYFSKYLKKIPLPPTVLSDPDIQQLMGQYENFIEEFKNVHVENAKYAKTGQTTLELRKEIEKISNDNMKVVAQIEKQKSKVENIPNKESLLISIKSFRNEVFQQKTLQNQIEDQNTIIAQLESQIKKSNQKLHKKQALRSGPNGMLAKLQEEVQTLGIITKDRLPQEYDFVKKQAELIEIVATEPQPNETELSDLQFAVDNMSLDLQKMVEKNILSNDPRDDKLAQFRQHASVIANNKQLAADSMMELKETASIIRRKVEEKENELQQTIGGIMPQGDELKRFVSKLRARSVIYKERRTQLLEVQAELGVLSRTQDILQQQNFSLAEALQNRNSDNQVQEEIVADNVQALTKACKDLAMQINNLSAETTLVRQQLQNCKIDSEELTKNYEQAKEIYNSSVTNFTAEIKKTEDEINDIEEQTKVCEDKWKTIKKDIERKEDISEKLQGDVDVQFGVGKKSQTDITNELIREQENIKKQIEEEMKSTMAEKENREQQMILWYSTLEILKCKKNSN